MLNGINLGDELSNSKLNEQIGVSGVVTNPINNPYKNIDKSLLIDETAISDTAVTLYQKEQEVKQFTPLVTSNPEDTSHEQLISALFNRGVSDPLSEESISSLSGNKKLLEDLGL